MIKAITKIGAALMLAGGLALAACAPMEPPATTTTSSTSTTSTTMPVPVNDYVPNPVPVTLSQTDATITINYDFGGPNTAVFFDVCKKASGDPTFNYTQDCDRGAVDAGNGSSDGTGMKEMFIPVGTTFGWRFLGQTIDQWGCFPDGYVVPAGFEDPDQCFIRVAEGTVFNNDTAIDMPLNWNVVGP